jgi:hypothetical protein
VQTCRQTNSEESLSFHFPVASASQFLLQSSLLHLSVPLVTITLFVLVSLARVLVNAGSKSCMASYMIQQITTE